MGIKKKLRELRIGFVNIDFLKISFSIYKHEGHRIKALKLLGFNSVAETKSFVALVSMDQREDGGVAFTATIPPDTPLSTLVHEAVHMADFALDYASIPITMENTETRAYLVQDIFEQLFDILKSLNDTAGTKITSK